MRIYTRTGDTGETGLYGGTRLPKDALRVESYGTVDEANALLGLAASAPSGLRGVLLGLQSELFVLGGDLATPLSVGLDRVPRITAAHTAQLEAQIDQWEDTLAPLQTFILPGGTSVSATLHLARTVVRRAERQVVALCRAEPEETSGETLRYLNRLADLLFVLARVANHQENTPDIPWTRNTTTP